MEKAGILHSKHDRLLLFKRKSEVIFVYIFLVIFFIAAMLLSDRFMTERNLRNLIISNIGLLFVAYGQLFIVLLGGVDLSVGSVISLTNVICVTMITENPSTWFLAFIASLAAGAGVGLVNGLLVDGCSRLLLPWRRRPFLPGWRSISCRARREFSPLSFASLSQRAGIICFLCS